jgi:hypothetical protein
MRILRALAVNYLLQAARKISFKHQNDKASIKQIGKKKYSFRSPAKHLQSVLSS